MFYEGLFESFKVYAWGIFFEGLKFSFKCLRVRVF
jgi:hypothetical protein